MRGSVRMTISSLNMGIKYHERRRGMMMENGVHRSNVSPLYQTLRPRTRTRPSPIGLSLCTARVVGVLDNDEGAMEGQEQEDLLHDP